MDSPYKMLDADVNNSGSITTADIALIRALVLGVVGSFSEGMWKFIPSDYVFPDVLSPWTAPAARDYNHVSGDALTQDFLAIRMGDVNGSWVPPGTLSGLSADLSAVTALMTAQFTLNWDPRVLEFVGVSNFGVSGMAKENFAVGQVSLLTEGKGRRLRGSEVVLAVFLFDFAMFP